MIRGIYLSSILFTLAVFVVASTLTGCDVAKYAAKCTLIQPENCN